MHQPNILMNKMYQQLNSVNVLYNEKKNLKQFGEEEEEEEEGEEEEEEE